MINFKNYITQKVLSESASQKHHISEGANALVWCGKAKQSTINRSERQVKRGKKLSSFIQIVSSSTGDSLI